MTIKARMIKAVAFPLGFLLGGLLIVGAAYIKDYPQVAVIPGHHPVVVVPSKGTPQYLIDQHHCWTRTQPKDVWVPGHVVVTLAGDDHPTYGGAQLTGRALDHLLPAGSIVHGYCR